MTAEEACTPARRIYFAMQTAYIGTQEERESGLADARRLAQAFQEATTSSTARALLDRAVMLAEQDDCYAALKLVRRIMRHEDAVLNPTAQANSDTSEPAAAEELPLSALRIGSELLLEELIPDRIASAPVGSDTDVELC